MKDSPSAMATFTTLAASEAGRLAREYGFDEVRSITAIPAGSVNSNFRLDLARGHEESACFLRIFEEQGVDGARYEVDLLDHLARRGVATPRPLSRADGAFTSTVSGKPVALFPFVGGVHSCQRAVDEKRARAVGGALAGAHVAGCTFAERRPGRFEPPDIALRLERVRREGGDALAGEGARLEARLREWLARRAPALPGGVIHGDLFRDNVLWAAETGDGHDQLVALLDFESASDGRFAYDLAATLLAWCVGARFDIGIGHALVEGYERVRLLVAEERDALRCELAIAAIRFAATRMTDYAMRVALGPRVVKDWRRFVERLDEVETLDVKAVVG